MKDISKLGTRNANRTTVIRRNCCERYRETRNPSEGWQVAGLKKITRPLLSALVQPLSSGAGGRNKSLFLPQTKKEMATGTGRENERYLETRIAKRESHNGNTKKLL
jgi:hypothetical protein